MESQVLEQVDRQRIVEIARNLADIVSITGEEKEVAEYLAGDSNSWAWKSNTRKSRRGDPMSSEHGKAAAAAQP